MKTKLVKWDRTTYQRYKMAMIMSKQVLERNDNPHCHIHSSNWLKQDKWCLSMNSGKLHEMKPMLSMVKKCVAVVASGQSSRLIKTKRSNTTIVKGNVTGVGVTLRNSHKFDMAYKLLFIICGFGPTSEANMETLRKKVCSNNVSNKQVTMKNLCILEEDVLDLDQYAKGFEISIVQPLQP